VGPFLKMKDCIFCKIVKGEIPCYKIYEDNEILAFLDVFPATKGQTLVVSKKHENYIFNLDEEKYSSLFLKAKKIAKAIDKALETKKTCIVVEGFEVDHVHIRLHPCYENKLKIKPMEEKLSKEELNEIKDKIKSFLFV